MVINAFSASLLSLSPVITRPPMSAVVMQPLGSDLYDSCSYFVSLSPSTPILFFIYTPLFPMLTPITRRKQNSSVSSFFFFFFCTIVLQHFFLFFLLSIFFSIPSTPLFRFLAHWLHLPCAKAYSRSVCRTFINVILFYFLSLYSLKKPIEMSISYVMGIIAHFKKRYIR